MRPLTRWHSPGLWALEASKRLVLALGLHLSRVSGSHHIYIHPDLAEPVDLQDCKGQAKPYQVRQVVELAERYALDVESKT